MNLKSSLQQPSCIHTVLSYYSLKKHSILGSWEPHKTDPGIDLRHLNSPSSFKKHPYKGSKQRPPELHQGHAVPLLTLLKPSLPKAHDPEVKSFSIRQNHSLCSIPSLEHVNLAEHQVHHQLSSFPIGHRKKSAIAKHILQGFPQYHWTTGCPVAT